MKKLIAIALVLVMALGILAGCQSAENKQPDKTTPSEGDTPDVKTVKTLESGKLIMSTNAAFPPYESTDDNGNYVGIDVEIAQAIAKKMGLELEILDMDFDAALLAVNQGKADIVMAVVTVNNDRLLVMDFSNTYANGVQVIIVKEGSEVTLDNMGDYTIGAQRGTTGFIYTSDEFGEDHVVAYDNGASAVQALLNGQVDCVVIDSAPAAEYVKANAGLTILETEYANEDYAIGMDKGNTELVDAVNCALNELIDDGTVQKIIQKYIPAQ